jgi:hypothetical protein
VGVKKKRKRVPDYRNRSDLTLKFIWEFSDLSNLIGVGGLLIWRSVFWVDCLEDLN